MADIRHFKQNKKTPLLFQKKKFRFLMRKFAIVNCVSFAQKTNFFWGETRGYAQKKKTKQNKTNTKHGI